MAKIEIAPETTFEAALQAKKFLENAAEKLDSLEKRIEVLVKDDGESSEWREFSDSGDTPPDTPRR